MRGSRVVLVGTIVGALLAVPTEAAANGGAYLELDDTHYLPGEMGTIVTYVSVPAGKQSIFDRGPFYVFVLPQGVRLEEGMPIPDGAIRIGTLAVEKEKDAFELATRFTTPDIASGFYGVGVCNDPCSVSGFREPLTGTISVVATEREAELLTRNDRLSGRVFGLQRQLRRSERHREELEAQMDFATSERGRLSSEIGRLQDELAAARQGSAGATSPGPSIVALLAVGVLAAGAVAFRRRRPASATRDLDVDPSPRVSDDRTLVP